MQTIEIVLTSTRDSMLKTLAEELKVAVDKAHEKVECSLLIICDNDTIAQSRFNKLFDFCPTTIHKTGRKPVVRWNAQDKRIRISEQMNLARELVDPNKDFVWIIEDDTEILPEALCDLLSAREQSTCTDGQEEPRPIGIVSGVQVGRHGIKHLGAWFADDPENPRRFSTLMFHVEHPPVEVIHAAGLYCCLLPMQLFIETQFRVTSQGTDVNFGLDIWNKGFVNLIVWSVICGHRHENTVLYPGEDCVVYTEEKDPNGIWRQKLEKARKHGH